MPAARLSLRLMVRYSQRVRVYFNTSALNRPFDDLRSPRVRSEAEAVATLVSAVEAGKLKVVSSEYLIFEVRRGPNPDHVAKVLSFVTASDVHVQLSRQLENRARALEKLGMRGLDALHVASAEAGRAGWLITTDDRLIRAARRAAGELTVRLVTPIEALAQIAWEGKQ